MILLLPWIPIVTAFLMLFICDKKETLQKALAIGSCAICSAITFYLFSQFDRNVSGFQFAQSCDWWPAFGMHYQVGLDGINMTLCLLHALVSLAGAFVSCWPEPNGSGTLGETGSFSLRRPKERLKKYLFFYLILTGAIYGVFTVTDIFLLYVFYELTLIPLYPMIGIWGSKNKEYGAMKLTLFITTGAVLSLFGIMLLYRQTGLSTFDYAVIREYLAANPLSADFQRTVAGLFLVGFGVMASMWPLHSWSPIGYAAAPTSVSMVHAGVLKKMGPYLILRLAAGLLPAGMAAWSFPLSILATIGILYAGYAAIKQQDLKFMVGFSSVSHMGYILLGMAAMTPASLSGVVLLMFSHGVMAAATFALIGIIYEQAHARGVKDFGGLSRQIPFVAICFILACMASLGLPGFSNFVSELLVFTGSWKSFPVSVSLAIFGVLITSIYLLRAIQSMCFGVPNPRWNDLKDAKTFAEKFPFILLIGALIVFGVWPQGLLNIIKPAVLTMTTAGATP